VQPLYIYLTKINKSKNVITTIYYNFIIMLHNTFYSLIRYIIIYVGTLEQRIAHSKSIRLFRFDAILHEPTEEKQRTNSHDWTELSQYTPE